MAEALGLASGVAGIVSLSVTVFQGCIKGIQIISAARHFGTDADRLRSILEWEQFRLLSWGERAGLAGAHSKPSPQLNWTLIYELLKQLETLLSDSETLRTRYNLQTVPDKEPDPSPKPETNGKGKGLRSFWSQVRPDILQARKSIIRDDTSIVKKLRWVSLDQEKLKALLGQIGYFNNCLYEMLASVDRDFIQGALSALLRSLIARTAESHDVDVLKAIIDPESLSDASSINAAADVKQLYLNLSGTNPQASQTPLAPVVARPKPRLAKLKLQWFVPYEKPSAFGRQTGIYDFSKRKVKSEVLLEWKRVEKAVEKKLERRIQELTSMMSSISDDSFHALKCLGYMVRENPDLSYNEYAYVFEIRDLNISNEKGHTQSPLNCLSVTLASGFKAPSLSYRVQCAKALADTVLQLHTSGWLHKAILPENVLFIIHSAQEKDMDPNTWLFDKSSGPHLAGYEFSRADNPLEMTEDVPSSPFSNLYRHPDAQGPARDSFQKSFDLYSLGCVLLELALWKPLPEILLEVAPPSSSTKDSKSVTKGNDSERKHKEMESMLGAKELLSNEEGIIAILEKAEVAAGRLYAEAVNRCFHPQSKAKAPSNEHDDDEDDEYEYSDAELSIQNELEIAAKLAEVKC